MLIKSGLSGDYVTTMNPLDVEGAKRLQHVSANYQHCATAKSGFKNYRSQSLDSAELNKLAADGKVQKAGLEHLVKL